MVKVQVMRSAPSLEVRSAVLRSKLAQRSRKSETIKKSKRHQRLEISSLIPSYNNNGSL